MCNMLLTESSLFEFVNFVVSGNMTALCTFPAEDELGVACYEEMRCLPGCKFHADVIVIMLCSLKKHGVGCNRLSKRALLSYDNRQ